MYREQRPNKSPSVASTTNLERQRMNELVFGEENRNHVVFETNLQREVMVTDRFANVRAMADQITLAFYGEKKFSNHIMGLYEQFFEARAKQGKQGLRGMNMKAVICALLYLIVLREQKVRLNLPKLIKITNNIRGQSTVKVTERMVNKYIESIENALKLKEENDNTNERKALHEEIMRIGISINETKKAIYPIIRFSNAISSDLIENHLPNKLALAIMYIYYDNHNKNKMRFIKMTPYIKNKIVPKLRDVLLPKKNKVFFKRLNVSVKPPNRSVQIRSSPKRSSPNRFFRTLNVSVLPPEVYKC